MGFAGIIPCLGESCVALAAMLQSSMLPVGFSVLVDVFFCLDATETSREGKVRRASMVNAGGNLRDRA